MMSSTALFFSAFLTVALTSLSLLCDIICPAEAFVRGSTHLLARPALVSSSFSTILNADPKKKSNKKKATTAASKKRKGISTKRKATVGKPLLKPSKSSTELNTNEDQSRELLATILDKSFHEGCGGIFLVRWKNIAPQAQSNLFQRVFGWLMDETISEAILKVQLRTGFSVLLDIRIEEEGNLGEVIDRIYEECIQNNLVATSAAEDEEETNEDKRRMVNIAHEILETNLSHNFDLVQFSNRVEQVFDSFYEKKNKNSRKISRYIAPYFVVVQSSGMGKTKLLYEYKKRAEARKDQPIAKLILCRSCQDGIDRKKEEMVFDTFLSLDALVKREKTFDEIAADIFHYLDDVLLKDVAKEPRVVLMFDEAQYLLKSAPYKAEGGEKKMDAFLFRMIRLWVSRIPEGNGPEIVAVFTGTTAKLQNFLVQDDLEKRSQTDSRNYRQDLGRFYERGSEIFDPFCTMTTIGCLRRQPPKFKGDRTEYQQAIPFGRPLFAVMTPEVHSKALITIVKRMLVDVPTWDKSEAAWLSILGTRVQMGQTTIEYASSLVSSAYANLMTATQASARISFMPDPVCARLAMCLMDEQWSMDLNPPGTVRGRPKTWWIKKAMDLYSRALCSPEKGNLGEVMVALYFLLCADLIRRQKDDDYNVFSVPLGEWIDVLVGGGNFAALTHTDSSTANSTLSRSCESEANHISFGAIQVCRNDIRAYDNSWKSLMDDAFLEYIYKSGIGFYTFPGCEAIDLVFPLRLNGDEGDLYFPMFVSVKSHVYFRPGDARKQCKMMVKKAKTASKGKENERALCVLVVFGSESVSNDKDFTLSDTCVDELLDGKIVARVLRVPMDDAFGLSSGFRELTTSKREISEVFASHSFLGAHLESLSRDAEKKKIFDGDNKEDAKHMLRTRPKTKVDDALNWTKDLFNALRSIVNS